MPELPEVETTRRGIAPLIVGQPIEDFIIYHPQLRWPVCQSLPTRLQNQTVQSCKRRGKYLLVGFDKGYQMIHLGMSGSDRKSTRLNSSHVAISYAVFCLNRNT